MRYWMRAESGGNQLYVTRKMVSLEMKTSFGSRDVGTSNAWQLVAVQFDDYNSPYLMDKWKA